jgi:hypothetical protein
MTTSVPRPSYSVARVSPGDAREDLLRLWSENLHVETTPAAKFDWLYRAAPLLPEHVWLLRASTAAAPVGTAGVGLRRMQLPHGDATSGLLADLAVDKAHRSVGPALTLVRDVKSWALGALDMAYGFPNALAQGVFKRVGYHPLGTITRYARVLRHAGYAARVRELELSRVPPPARELLYRAAEQPWFAAVAGAAVDVAQLARRSPAAVEAARRLRVDHADTPDAAALDALWARARNEHAVIGHRSGAVLTWRFPPSPRRTWYCARARSGDHALRSYALVERSDDGAAHIKDLFGHKPDVVALLDLLPALVYRTGATSLSMRYLGAAWLADALAARGFTARQADRLIVVGTRDAMPAASAEAVRNPDSWHLTDFDEDA